MATTARQVESLASQLASLSLSEPDYWSFRGNAKRDHGHGLMQYPAMMVPQMVRELLKQIALSEKTVSRVGDPFVGSGTVLTEALLLGKDFVGRDINPLALLLCRVKSDPIFPEAIRERSDELKKRIKGDRKQRIEVTFDGIDKWFTKDVQRSLSRIRRAIESEPYEWARRFFWVSMAETVRLTSNSRTSTFKLHIRSREDRRSRSVNPHDIYFRLLDRNIVKYDSLANALREKGVLQKGHFVGNVELSLADTRDEFVGHTAKGKQCDVIVTSPPYGDNATTVPYGQYSYLPLQWIDLSDIHPDINKDILATTHEIDRLSLGGIKKTDEAKLQALFESSSALKNISRQLKKAPPDRLTRVVAFVRDLNECIPNVLNLTRSKGVMVWILGNRRVGGQSIPLDNIITELIGTKASLVTRIQREIPSKRMAVRNSVAKTMRAETILVFRKA